MRQISHSRLSTIRMPIPQVKRRLSLYNDGFYTTTDQLSSISSRLATATKKDRVQCTHPNNPLPCASGAFENNCIDDLRQCQSEFQNSYEPILEIQINKIPRLSERSNRLFGLEIKLPQNKGCGARLGGADCDVFRV